MSPIARTSFGPDYAYMRARLGRSRFGVGHRATPKSMIDRSVEIGTTDDATDLRASPRIPLFLNP